MIYYSTTDKKNKKNMRKYYRMTKRSRNWTAMDLVYQGIYLLYIYIYIYIYIINRVKMEA
jgi:hypothetical protein